MIFVGNVEADEHLWIPVCESTMDATCDFKGGVRSQAVVGLTIFILHCTFGGRVCKNS